MFTISIHFQDCIIDTNGIKKTDLTGADHFIGKQEKRRNQEIIHIKLPYNHCNYAMFYKGSNDILKTACFAMIDLLTKNLTEKEKASRYKTIIESLHIVHHVSTKTRHSKLNGINSLSTSCVDNCFCEARMLNKDSVCAKCYASTQQKTQLALQDRNTINGIILRNIFIPAKYWKKYFNHADLSKFFRIESFGDVANKIQTANYIELCKAFPRVHFAAWTKNLNLWENTFDFSGKPENLSFIVSSNKVNQPELHHANNSQYINHVFTVYDKK